MTVHPLAQNQRLIAELAEHLPGVAQHPSMFDVPPGLHSPAREAQALETLVDRFEALRLRVCDDVASAEPTPRGDSVVLADPLGRHEALTAARQFLLQPIALRREAPWQFLVLPLEPAGTGHLVAIKVNHIAADAPSRYTFIAERVAATRDVAPAARPVDRAWRRYQAWEAERVATLDLEASLEPLAGHTGWEFSTGTRGRHAGMRLGDVRRHPAPAWAVDKGRRAIALFVTSLGLLGRRTGLAPVPAVAVPHSFRRQSGCLDGIGDFVDHLVVPVAAGSAPSTTLAAVDDHLTRELAAGIPLRLRVAQSGRALLEDPAPFTQAIISFQPSSDVAAPYLLALPDEHVGVPGERGERVLPVDVPVVPLERQDIAVMCCVHRSELRWRLSTRTDVVGEEDHRHLESLLETEVHAVAEAPSP